MFRVLKRMPWIVVGAAGALLFDGEKGAERRKAVKAKVDSVVGNGHRDTDTDDLPVSGDGSAAVHVA